MTTKFELGYSFYEANKDAIESPDPEVLLIGPAETGKTLALLWKVHRVASKYPKASCVIARKTLTSIYSTVLQTWENKIIVDDPSISVYGGNKAQWYDYSNGSRVWTAGLDKSSRILSAEHDLIYVNQPEELSIADWETLTTRTTGRAGHVPHPQTIGDPNPAWPQHWMYQRAGISRFYSWHKYNPMLYDQQTGQITEQGQRTQTRLMALTGLRRKRLWLGQAAQAEGVVYEGWQEQLHLLDRFEIPASWRKIRAIDFGYTNPFVCQWWAIDPDGRAYLYREIYKAGVIVEEHAKEIKRLSAGEQIEATICDHDAEDRATLKAHGVPTIAAKKAVTVGIQTVESRLKRAGDGKPRLFVLRDSCLNKDQELVREYKPACTQDEFGAYIWQPAAEGKANKEAPMQLYDHGMDAMRYGVMYLDSGQGPPTGQTVQALPQIAQRQTRQTVWQR